MTAAPLPAPLPCPWCGQAMEQYAASWRHPRADACMGWAFTLHDDAQLAAWNRRAPEAQAWRAIETAPRDGSVMLLGGCAHGSSIRMGGWGLGRYNRSTKEYEPDWSDGPSHGFAPTHWQPLPAPPGATPAAPPAREAALEAIRYFLDYEDDRDPFRTREQAVARLRAALAEAEGRAL